MSKHEGNHERPKHPSGRPKPKDEEKRGWTYPRPPNAQPLTPGLQRSHNTNAVGFLIPRPRDEQDED